MKNIRNKKRINISKLKDTKKINIKQKSFLVMIFIIGILLIGTNENYAVNTTNMTQQESSVYNTTSTNNSSNGQIYATNNTSGSNSNTKTNTSSSSNTTTTLNNNSSTSQNSNGLMLNSLGIKPYDFTGFKNAKTSYDVTVPENVASVEVYATAKEKTSTIEGIGKKTLEKGKNVVEVTVVAQDGARKTFTINIIRGKEETEESKSDDTEDEKNLDSDVDGEYTDVNSKTEGLQSISISGLELSPQFETNIYDYSVKYVGEDTQLPITTIPTNENYIVEVMGNNDLVEGNNTITILVSDANGSNVATYQIDVQKSLVDEEAIAKQKQEEEAKQKAEKQKKIVICVCAGIAIVVFITVMCIFIKNRKDKDDEEFSEISSYGDDYEDDYEEIPKSLRRGKSFQDEGQMTKDQAKEKYLNNYENYNESLYETNDDIKRQKRGNSKGKRYK